MIARVEIGEEAKPVTRDYRRNSEQDQRDGDRPGGLVQLTLTYTTVGTPPQASNAATFTTKGQDIGTQHIESRQTGCQQRDCIYSVVTVVKSKANNCLFTIEACEERETGDRERSDEPGNSGDRHILSQRAHQAHILDHLVGGMVQRSNNATGAQKEQS